MFHDQASLTRDEQAVDDPDGRERRDYAPDAIDEQIPPARWRRRSSADGAHAAERKRDQEDDDECVEDHGSQHRRLPGC